MKNDDETFAFLPNYYGTHFSGHVGLFSKRSRQTRYFDSSSLSALVLAAKEASEQDDVYVPISTQLKAFQNSSRGSTDSVSAVFGFFCDIDLASEKKSNKNYPRTMDEALGILAKFPHPPSALINSGNGLHAHWLFERPFEVSSLDERQEIVRLSKAFQSQVRQHFAVHEREIDSVGDIMRNFRIPGTLNHSTSPPKLVSILEYHPDRRYSLAKIAINLPPKQNEKAGTASYRKKNWPASHEAITKECSWYAFHTGEGAQSSSEPDWFAVASIVSRCEGGEELWHGLSSRYPGYDFTEAQRKYEHARDDAGPRTCVNIEGDLGHTGCMACPHRGKITSPLQLGTRRKYQPGNTGPLPLGFTRDGNFVFRDPVRNIILTANAQQLLSKQYLVGLAPSEFWESQFPSKNGFDFGRAGETLLALCRDRGPFNPQMVRGRGVWIEDGRIIVNLGEPIPNGLRYHYLCFEAIDVPKERSFETDRLLRFLQLFNWRHPIDAVLVLGWLAIAPICGVLKWRPHMFIFGPPRCGKTTIHTVASDILSLLAISTDGQSSEAGVRQTLGPDSLVVIMDEFESDRNIHGLKAIIRLARSASSAETKVLRGTPEGRAMQFSLRTSFLFCAINPTGLTPADESRIVLVELKMHDNNADVASQIAEHEAHFRTLGSQWCGFMVGLAQSVSDAVVQIEKAIPVVDRRHKQNMAALLAGAYVALNKRVPDEIEAKAWVEQHLSAIEQHAEELDRDDAAESLEHLLSHIVEAYPLGHWIAVAHEAPESSSDDNATANARRIMQMFGMTFWNDGRTAYFVISNQAPQVEKAYSFTHWDGRAWLRALRKLEGVIVPAVPLHFPHLGRSGRGTAVPVAYLPDRIEGPADEPRY